VSVKLLPLQQRLNHISQLEASLTLSALIRALCPLLMPSHYRSSIPSLSKAGHAKKACPAESQITYLYPCQLSMSLPSNYALDKFIRQQRPRLSARRSMHVWQCSSGQTVGKKSLFRRRQEKRHCSATGNSLHRIKNILRRLLRPGFASSIYRGVCYDQVTAILLGYS